MLPAFAFPDLSTLPQADPQYSQDTLPVFSQDLICSKPLPLSARPLGRLDDPSAPTSVLP